MDVIDETAQYIQQIGIFDENMRLFISISIAICILFIIIALLTLKLFNGIFMKVRNGRNSQQLQTINDNRDDDQCHNRNCNNILNTNNIVSANQTQTIMLNSQNTLLQNSDCNQQLCCNRDRIHLQTHHCIAEMSLITPTQTTNNHLNTTIQSNMMNTLNMQSHLQCSTAATNSNPTNLIHDHTNNMKNNLNNHINSHLFSNTSNFIQFSNNIHRFSNGHNLLNNVTYVRDDSINDGCCAVLINTGIGHSSANFQCQCHHHQCIQRSQHIT